MDEKTITRAHLLKALTIAIDKEPLNELVEKDPAIILILPIIVFECWANIDEAIKTLKED